MSPILKNILAVLAGLLVGNVVNMGLIMLGPVFVANPEGVDVNDFESIAAHIQDYKPIHFLFPFLAHALGTLAGAWVATRVAGQGRLIPALIVGVFFLVGGITMATLLPAPLWFILSDLGLAYLPMTFIGYALGRR